FVIVWIAGLIASFMLRMRLKSNILVIVMLAAALGASGGLWAYRWFANKLREEWPIGHLAAPLAVPLRWPRSWVINWAGMWGVFSTSLALAFEIFWLWLVTQLFGPTLTDVVESAPLTRSLPLPIILIVLFVGVAIIGPLIEEACKAIGLRLMRSAIQRPLDGLMMGMAAGIGFGLVESALYLGALGSPWLINGWVRLITLLLHGVATSIVGVAYARSLRTGRRRDVLAGYGRAVLLHGSWNAVAIGTLIGFATSEWLILGLACAGVLLLVTGRLIPRTIVAGVQTVVQEGYEQANESLPPEWSPADYGLGWRLMGSRPIIVPGTPRTVSAPPPIEKVYIQRVEDDLKSE
ncbi:MAG TPA: PrsW family glutamic-type intramembrane protease, partial [Anaerolineae bacterium]|nr:PrsW family glutamic-type intramembrane protease [Anaerolineae bacterium]